MLFLSHLPQKIQLQWEKKDPFSVRGGFFSVNEPVRGRLEESDEKYHSGQGNDLDRKIRTVTVLPFFKNEKGSSNDQQKTDNVIPPQFLIKIDYGKNGKDDQRNYLLDSLQFCRIKLTVSEPVCRHHEAIFKKGDPPACENNLPEGDLFKF